MLHETKSDHKPRISSLLTADPMTPDQYYAMMQRSYDLQPDRRLMLAVLDNALECFQKHLQARTRRGKRLLQETEEWILERDRRWAFSFENICESLDLDPEYLRKGLLHLKKRAQAAHSRPLPK